MSSTGYVTVVMQQTLTGRFMKVTLQYTGASGTLKEAHGIVHLLEERAPQNAGALWHSQPSGAARSVSPDHREVHALVPRFTEQLSIEHEMVAVPEGGVMVFDYTGLEMDRAGHPEWGIDGATGLSVCFGEQNLLLQGNGCVRRGSLVGRVIAGFGKLALVHAGIYRDDAEARLTFDRASPDMLRQAGLTIE